MGKTTLAQIVANTLQLPFYTLSAVTSGVKDVREVIDKARGGRFFNEGNPILFIDEIHRFSKSQQDSLLGAVEKGVVTLIGATTENPSFEVIRPLLSRCQLYVLKPLGDDDLMELMQRAITHDPELSQRQIVLKETGAILRYSGGDARKLLNILELVVESSSDEKVVIEDKRVVECLGGRLPMVVLRRRQTAGSPLSPLCFCGRGPPPPIPSASVGLPQGGSDHFAR